MNWKYELKMQVNWTKYAEQNYELNIRIFNCIFGSRSIIFQWMSLKDGYDNWPTETFLENKCFIIL